MVSPASAVSRPPNNTAIHSTGTTRSTASTSASASQVQSDVPQVSINGARQHSGSTGQRVQKQHREKDRERGEDKQKEEAAANENGWGANFWVTLVEPQSQAPFYACPATGQVSWDPPIGNFVLPPSPEGEWWELIDDSRGGIPYYYHTKTNETVWERPQDAFVIPLAILQNSALCKRLSARYSQAFDLDTLTIPSSNPTAIGFGRSVSDTRVPAQPTAVPQTPKRSFSEQGHSNMQGHRHLGPGHLFGQQQGASLLPTIPASPYHTQTEDSSSVDADSSLNANGSGGASGPPSARGGKSEKRREEVLKQRAQAQAAQRGQDREKGKGKQSNPQSLDGAATRTAHKTTPPRKSVLKQSSRANGNRNGASEPPTPVSPTFTTDWSRGKEGETDMTVLPSASNSAETDAETTLNPDVSFNPQLISTPSRKSDSSPSISLPPSVPPLPFFNPNTNLNFNLGLTIPGARKNGDGDGRSSLLPTPISPGSAITTSSIAMSLASNSNEAAASERAKGVERIYGGSSGEGRKSKGDLSEKEERESGKMSRKSFAAERTQSMFRTHDIGNPVFDKHRTMELSPIKARLEGKPILVDVKNNLENRHRDDKESRLSTGGRPVLPDELASDIQQFCQVEFARQYFMTHRTGFIFKRKVPIEKMMVWQKSSISSPLLVLNRDRELHKSAVKVFKIIQRIMGDLARDRPIIVRAQASDSYLSMKSSATSLNQSTTSLHNGFGSNGGYSAKEESILEDERWLLTEGIMHGELRDEIYCQVVKQLTNNPSPESVFRGWQLMCVLLVTFPPSKNFEEFLRPFLRTHTQHSHSESRVDVMAKYCLQRLLVISKKGPRGKTPTAAEIETASDAAFNPSTFGESLDAILRLQERTYPHLQVPIILPFLADGILALGGTQAEGIFRIPGDGDAVSDLKVRIERGYYNLEGFHDPHVPASLLKLWLRELVDPLVPTELYNDCVACARDPESCVRMVGRLPTYHRRVVLFVISFLQLFLEGKIMAVTKMTSANLALVMAPNLLRCESESMTVVFTNAPYEQMFVHNLLLHLKCNKVDPGYVPKHGLGSAVPANASQGRRSKSRTRKSGR